MSDAKPIRVPAAKLAEVHAALRAAEAHLRQSPEQHRLWMQLVDAQSIFAVWVMQHLPTVEIATTESDA